MQFQTFTRPGRSIALAVAALAVAAPAVSAAKPEERVGKPEERVTKPEERAAKPGERVGKPGERVAKPGERAANTEERAAKNEERAATRKERAAERFGGKREAAADGGCEDRVFSRVFQPWNDRGLYTLAPGGDLETQAEGWTLTGRASIATESAPFLLGSELGTGSLELSAGASAVSPKFCVSRGFPSFRFVARSASDEKSVLKVEVVYASGKVKRTGRLTPGADWAPTRKLSLAQGRFKTKRRGSALIQLRFAAVAGTVRMDDVYVDPRYKR